MADDQHLEQLSCLLDSELDDSRARFLTSRLLTSAQLRSRWRSYQLIGATLRSERHSPADDLASRVSAALAGEGLPTRDGANRRSLRPVAGFAIAAAVAISAYNLLDAGRTTTALPQPLLAAEVERREAPPVNANFDAAPSLPQRASVASGTDTVRPALIDPRVQTYLLRHNEAAGRRSQGLVPYIHMVTAQPAAEQPDAVRNDAAEE